MIGYGKQSISDEDVAAVVEVLRSDFLTQGPAVSSFEEAVAGHVGSAHGVACCNATAALHLARLALGVGRGDVVWTVSTTFVASANCALYCGGQIDFVDINPLTWNMDVDCLRNKLVYARTQGRLPKVVVPVHLCGLPTDQEAIAELSREYGFAIVEDASHAIGASHSGEAVGSCRWSDITVFSFHPVKIVTTGEGGMALTNDSQLADRMRLFASHGITKSPEAFEAQDPGPWHYEQHQLGFNYRLSDIHAALGRSQLSRLSEFVDRRNVLADIYREAFEDLPLASQEIPAGSTSAFHLYVVRLKPSASVSHRETFQRLREAGIGVNLHYTPVHLQPYYRQVGFQDGYLPESEAYGRSAITLPLYPGLTASEQAFVIETVRSIMGSPVSGTLRSQREV